MEVNKMEKKIESNMPASGVPDTGAKSGGQENSLPLKKFRAGPVSATIWQNNGQGKDGMPYNYSTVKLERCYKDKNGEWQNTASMRFNDLPRAALVANKAYEFLCISTGEHEQAN